MQQVVLTHIVGKNLEHRAVEIGVDRIARMELDGFIAVHRHAGGEELLRVFSGFREEVHHLAAV